MQLQQGSQQSPQGVLEPAGSAELSCLGVRGQAFATFRALSLHSGCPFEAILGEGHGCEPASHRQLSWPLENESLGPGAWKGNWVCTQQVCGKAAGGTGMCAERKKVGSLNFGAQEDCTGRLRRQVETNRPDDKVLNARTKM